MQTCCIGGIEYEKIGRDDIIKEGAMHSWNNGTLTPLINSETVGQKPLDFSSNRDFYNPVQEEIPVKKNLGYPLQTQEGYLSVEQELPANTKKCVLGVQISKDGRIWVCIDGVAFIRFRPMLG